MYDYTSVYEIKRYSDRYYSWIIHFSVMAHKPFYDTSSRLWNLSFPSQIIAKQQQQKKKKKKEIASGSILQVRVHPF